MQGTEEVTYFNISHNRLTSLLQTCSNHGRSLKVRDSLPQPAAACRPALPHHPPQSHLSAIHAVSGFVLATDGMYCNSVNQCKPAALSLRLESAPGILVSQTGDLFENPRKTGEPSPSEFATIGFLFFSRKKWSAY
ncbi:hypothetical protein CEXT_30651 [Caerostris extrusa]|uniref:Uncharacterized protein n=1 Tax=Caerostris extrusa TaxID=172846 RepID=A0AAV4RYU4_CAEEX|nr:hypothetical protein CEXT_30651 [Caerostris extrusa]